MSQYYQFKKPLSIMRMFQFDWEDC